MVTEEPVRIAGCAGRVDPHAVQSYMFGQSPATVDYECPALTCSAVTLSVPRHRVTTSFKEHDIMAIEVRIPTILR